MGVCRSFPRSLVFAMDRSLGLEICHLHSLQKVFRIRDIITHVHHGTMTGRLYRASFEIFLMELGVDLQFLQLSQDLILCLATPSLIKSFILFFKELNISYIMMPCSLPKE
jgi:hypothetical protein